jgi:hypothetical protein
MTSNDTRIPAPPIYDNSFYRHRIIRPLAQALSPLFHRIGFSPNGVCWLKLFIGLVGALFLTSVPPEICFIGVILLQIGVLLDAVDGEVARLQGSAGKLAGEYWDKLCDHLPKTAMYFCWGYGAYKLTGWEIPLFCGMILGGWNIYPRFCGVETLLERLDKAPEVQNHPKFPQALAKSFAVNYQRGKIDYWLTVFFHPAINAITICFLIEIIIPSFDISGFEIATRSGLLYIYTAVGLANFVRKGIRFYMILDF